MPLYGTPGHSHDAAYLAVRHIQHKAQNQNALLLLGQIGKGGGDKLIVDIQAAPMRRKHKAVAGVAVYRRELVPFFRGKRVQRLFMAAFPLQFLEIVNGFMVQYQLAVAVKLPPFVAKLAVGYFHFVHPLSVGGFFGGVLPFRS